MTFILILIIVVQALFILYILLLSKRVKYSGTINVIETEEKKTFTLELDIDPDDLEKQQTAIFKINSKIGLIAE